MAHKSKRRHLDPQRIHYSELVFLNDELLYEILLMKISSNDHFGQTTRVRLHCVRDR